MAALIAVPLAWAAAETPMPGATGSKLMAGLDTHHFEITTDSEETQAWFNQGLVLLYGFNHGEAWKRVEERSTSSCLCARALEQG